MKNPAQWPDGGLMEKDQFSRDGGAVIALIAPVLLIGIGLVMFFLGLI